MSKQAALLVAALAVMVLVAFLFWGPTRAGVPLSTQAPLSPGQPSTLLPAVVAPSTSASGPAFVASPQAQEQLATLKQILSKKNDNDPRLDRELRSLPDDAKTLFEAEYAAYAPEARNPRGTIVFLVGRNLTRVEDVDFMARVLAEPPCLSLAKCSEAPPPSKSDDDHIETANEITLVYPQLVALKAAEAYLARSDARPEIAARLRAVLEAASTSELARVSQMAQQILAAESKRSR